MYTPQQLATALQVPIAEVQTNWPQILAALTQEGINDHPTRVAVLATIGTEVPGFAPIPEYGTGEEYNGRIDLGNTQPGDGPRYKGRGFIQLTGRSNYTTYGQLLGLDLVGNPDLALDVHIAALILALYCKERGIPTLAAAGNWVAVREAVNGGDNGLARFLQCVHALEAMPEPADPPPHYHVLTIGALKSAPNHTCRAAIDPQRHPVMLKPGDTVMGTGKEEPGWLEVKLPPSPVHGWYPTSALRKL